MNDSYSIDLICNGNKKPAIFSKKTKAIGIGFVECYLMCFYDDKELKSIKYDFFDALCEIRIELEKYNLIPFCYGASLNVFPSGMGRQMSLGISAYKLELGKKTTEKDLVGIFDVGTDIIPATVEEQSKFYIEWCQSK